MASNQCPVIYRSVDLALLLMIGFLGLDSCCCTILPLLIIVYDKRVFSSNESLIFANLQMTEIP